MAEEQSLDGFFLALRVIARPSEANSKGDIFGGWLMAQIDLAGSIIAIERAKGSVATVAVKELHFIKPVYLDDVVSFYCKITAVGKSSITVAIEVWVRRVNKNDTSFQIETVKVAEAVIVYVAVEEPGKKREVPVA